MYYIKYYDENSNLLYIDRFTKLETAKKYFDNLKNVDIFDYFDYSKIILFDLLRLQEMEVLYKNDLCS